MIECGKNMGLKERKCKQIIDKTKDVFNRFSEYADAIGIKEQTVIQLDSVIKNNFDMM